MRDEVGDSGKLQTDKRKVKKEERSVSDSEALVFLLY